MKQNEDLFIKISTDFHNEINPILREIDPLIISHYWYSCVNINGKFEILKRLLLSLNRTEASKSILTELKITLEFYNNKLIQYFATEKLATCFIYFAPENITKTKFYFDELTQHTFKFKRASSFGYSFFIGFDIAQFPNDCSFKLSAKLDNGVIDTEYLAHPFFEGETMAGILNNYTSRSRAEQIVIETSIKNKMPTRIQAFKDRISEEFRMFCEETHDINIQLLLDIKQAIADVDFLLKRMDQNVGFSFDVTKIKPIYKVLSNGYINVGFDEFTGIFKPYPPKNKIVWLKSGARLKYLIDQLDIKYHLSPNINIWASERFQSPNTINLATFLRKQTSKAEYQILFYENDPNDELYKALQQ
ncbi:MAG TPA: hypothetical protein VIK55_03605 [Paludibacter sp.]